MTAIYLPLSDVKRATLANLVCGWIRAGIGVQGTMSQWWEAVERQHRNEPPSKVDAYGKTPEEVGYSIFHMPLSQPRLDMLTAQVCTVVAKQTPYMRDTSSDEQIAEKKQRIVHNAWQQGGFESAIRKASTMAADTDLAYLRVQLGKVPGTLEIRAYHPGNVVIWPALPEGIEECVCIGNQFSRIRSEIDFLRDQKVYYPGPDLPDGDPTETQDETESYASGAEYGIQSEDRGTQTVNLYDLCVKLPQKEYGGDGYPDQDGRSWYRCILDYDSQTLLLLVPLYLSSPPYFRCYFIGSTTDYYSAKSVGRNLYPCQELYNNLWSLFYSGTAMASQPATIGPPLQDGEKIAQYGFGAYIEVDTKPEGWAVPSQFQGSAAFPHMLQAVEQQADQIARISQNTQGAKADVTATEAQIVAAGVAVGVEEYIANFTSDFARMANVTLEYVAHAYDAFTETIGEVVEEPMPMMPMSGMGAM